MLYHYQVSSAPMADVNNLSHLILSLLVASSETKYHEACTVTLKTLSYDRFARCCGSRKNSPVDSEHGQFLLNLKY